MSVSIITNAFQTNASNLTELNNVVGMEKTPSAHMIINALLDFIVINQPINVRNKNNLGSPVNEIMIASIQTFVQMENVLDMEAFSMDKSLLIH